MNYNDTKLLSMLRTYGIKRIFTSSDFIVALVLTIIFISIVWYYQLASQLIPDLFAVYATTASGMIAIIVASLAIIVSISDNDFISLILSESDKVYQNILFVFWYTSILAGLSVAINVISYIFVRVNMGNNYAVLTLIAVATFITAYAIFAVIQAIGTVMRFGLYRAEFTKITKKRL